MASGPTVPTASGPPVPWQVGRPFLRLAGTNGSISGAQGSKRNPMEPSESSARQARSARRGCVVARWAAPDPGRSERRTASRVRAWEGPDHLGCTASGPAVPTAGPWTMVQSREHRDPGRRPWSRPKGLHGKWAGRSYGWPGPTVQSREHRDRSETDGAARIVRAASAKRAAWRPVSPPDSPDPGRSERRTASRVRAWEGPDHLGCTARVGPPFLPQVGRPFLRLAGTNGSISGAQGSKRSRWSRTNRPHGKREARGGPPREPTRFA